jgi:hypothetical protein
MAATARTIVVPGCVPEAYEFDRLDDAFEAVRRGAIGRVGVRVHATEKLVRRADWPAMRRADPAAT